jgi:hypothetical protein
MGYIVGTGDFPSTWFSMRAVTLCSTLSPPPSPFIGNHNEQYAASPGYLRTIEGNGLLRVPTPAASSPIFISYAFEPPIEGGNFTAGYFAEPYPDQLLGRSVSTSGGSFTITAAAFTPEGQTLASGGNPPINVQWFQALT